MSITAKRSVIVEFDGDFTGTEEFEAADNDASPCFVQQSQIPAGQTLTFGNPTAGAFGSTGTTVAVTILKPSDYAGTLILKGNSSVADGDGIPLHPTDPDTITLSSTFSSFAIKASADVALRLIWS